MIKHTDNLGRVVIPKHMRKSWGLPEGEKSAVEMTVIGEEYIILTRYREKDRCCVCNTTKDDLRVIRDEMGVDRRICAYCAHAVIKLSRD